MTREDWDRRLEACSAVANIITALGVVIGGASAIYTYQKQASAEVEQKQNELKQIRHFQKRELYYELVDIAAAVATSTTATEAKLNSIKYYRLYYGKAHIFLLDPTVNKAKVNFKLQLDEALEKGKWPSGELKSHIISLTSACEKILLKEEDALVGNQS